MAASAGSETLRDHVCVVTGASRGIGRAIARELAGRGAVVVVAARSPEPLAELVEEIERDGGRALARTVDVADEGRVSELIGSVEADLGAIDLLVNNAGGSSVVGPPWEIGVEDWWGDVTLNLKSPFLTTRLAVPAMIERGSGRIVNLVSLLGTKASPFTSAYTAAKGGLILFTESLEEALAGTGVHAFSLSPGMVRTEGMESTMFTAEGRRWLPEISTLDESVFLPPERAAELVAEIATGRCDPLAGCFLRVTEDLEATLADAERVRAEALLALRIRGR